MNEKNRPIMEFMLEYIQNHAYFKSREISKAFILKNIMQFKVQMGRRKSDEAKKLIRKHSCIIGGYLGIFNEIQNVAIRQSRNNTAPFIVSKELIQSIKDLLNGKKYPKMNKGTPEQRREWYYEGLERNGKA